MINKKLKVSTDLKKSQKLPIYFYAFGFKKDMAHRNLKLSKALCLSIFKPQFSLELIKRLHFSNDQKSKKISSMLQGWKSLKKNLIYLIYYSCFSNTLRMYDTYMTNQQFHSIRHFSISRCKNKISKNSPML